ncbi:hypothetical protein B4119_3666 [Parageobacillus caldoxylosilyticus]|uniref:Uncharacterized protein n=1 Tax=Saccharococcus caldoxylosilyticus TaxID=81408 RepID=A0A150LXI2_9BACL|nr:hypothetical protein B4119_3666 [Parageobacillus caldoxylosilyticus]
MYSQFLAFMRVEKGNIATKDVVLLYDVGAWFYINSFFST